MRLTLCVKHDLHGCIFLNHLLPQLDGHEITVLLSEKYRPHESDLPALAQMAFLEQGLPLDTLFPAIDACVAAGGRPGKWLTFNGLAERYGFETRTAQRSAQLAGILEAWQPDLVISARFSLIFKPNDIRLPKHGILNIHPAELPAFGGLYTPMRTVAEGHTRFACTLHRIDEGIDTGPIVHIAYRPIPPGEALLHQTAEIYPLVIPQLLHAIERFAAGQNVPVVEQDASRRRYSSFPSPEEIVAFHARGGRFWDGDAYLRLIAPFRPKGMENGEWDSVRTMVAELGQSCTQSPEPVTD
jgi:folate-dependent phosphoribosylglycinamide formyltransferase PurN